jgi:hypothetical protein
MMAGRPVCLLDVCLSITTDTTAVGSAVHGCCLIPKMAHTTAIFGIGLGLGTPFCMPTRTSGVTYISEIGPETRLLGLAAAGRQQRNRQPIPGEGAFILLHAHDLEHLVRGPAVDLQPRAIRIQLVLFVMYIRTLVLFGSHKYRINFRCRDTAPPPRGGGG